MRGDTLATTTETQALGGGGLDVDLSAGHAEIGGKVCAHGINMRSQFRRLGNDSEIDVADDVTLFQQLRNHPAQQDTTVDILEFGAGIGKMAADITPPGRAQQGIAQGVNGHITIRMGNKALPKGNTLPA